jgi:hypothetical protein
VRPPGLRPIWKESMQSHAACHTVPGLQDVWLIAGPFATAAGAIFIVETAPVTSDAVHIL